jgi:phosphoribosyl 1,2-cyclic phosphodiesterase
MRAISLQSGSNGNCVYVEASRVKLLIDAGISGKQAQLRLAAIGRDIRDVDAVLITHDHNDHVRCAGVYQRKFHLPIHITPATFNAAQRDRSLGKLIDVRHFTAGQPIAIGDVLVHTLPTPHDGADGCAMIIDDGQSRLGVMTDLGHPFDGLDEAVATLDAVFLESNHDERMLANGPYPAFLKRRVRGPGGHLSNLEAAELIARSGARLRWAALAHLSSDNNTPECALATHRQIVGERVAIHHAGRHEPAGPWEV